MSNVYTDRNSSRGTKLAVRAMTVEDVRREARTVIADLRRQLAEVTAERDRFRAALVSARKAAWIGSSKMDAVVGMCERMIDHINTSMREQSEGAIGQIDELLGYPAEGYDYEPADRMFDGSARRSDSAPDSGTMLVDATRSAANW